MNAPARWICHTGTTAGVARRRPGLELSRSAFSLTEVLIAILILGIGIISIAALFPAGIAQQRQSADDVFGPIVAENAISLLRSRLNREDFGTFEEFIPQFDPALDFSCATPAPRPTIRGDWTWIRPSILRSDDPSTLLDELGAIDVFSHDWWVAPGGSGPTAPTTEFAPPNWSTGYEAVCDDTYAPNDPLLYGVPWALNRDVDGYDPPRRVIITQRERYYPTPPPSDPADELNDTITPPQFVWDCMFRRYQGRILVAIFVYRVSRTGGEPIPYVVAPNPTTPAIPPLPIHIELGTVADSSPAWDTAGDDGILGTVDDAVVGPEIDCDTYDYFDASLSWREAGQWIIDQNNNVHRVLSAQCNETTNLMEVELVRRVPALPSFNVFYLLGPNAGIDNVVSEIWYLPAFDSDEGEPRYRLTPVYATVKEL